jgi:DUF1365 family protein
MSEVQSAIYTGWVRHRRFEPAEHSFRYRLFQLSLDLGELDRVFKGRLLWSARRPNLAWLRRKDHFGAADVSLDTVVRDLVEDRTGRRPGGSIRLLTHLRYFGYCMNPVSFYYCYEPDEAAPRTIVAEVHNTPWNERHCYVLDRESNLGSERKQRFRFRKDFHVSPFMSMDHEYDWRFTAPGDRLAVHMINRREGRTVFDATMALVRKPITGANLARVLAGHPFMTGKVITAIYWQALRLWMKRVPFHSHPKHRLQQQGAGSP